MQIETIEELIEVLHGSSLTRLEVKSERWSLQLERPNPARHGFEHHAPAPAGPRGETPPPVSLFDEPTPVPELTYIESPMVGVFHEVSRPVAVGQTVRAGEVLGTIEALALRTEVRSPLDGEVSIVQVEDGQPVEYGQVLFALGRFGGDS